MMDYFRILVTETSVPFAFMVGVIVVGICVLYIAKKMSRQAEANTYWERQHNEQATRLKLLEGRKNDDAR